MQETNTNCGGNVLNHTTYIKNLFYSFIKDTDVVCERVMFVKHYNTLNMSLDDIEKIVGESYKKGLLYHRYSKNDIKEPFEPLISGIRYYYQKFFSNEMGVSEFIDNCNVYSLHKEIFVSYLSDGLAYRNEQIITSEVAYEEGKFIVSIINCLTYIAKKTNLLIVLDRFQLAAFSSMKVINNMINNLDDCRIKILIIYNELQSPLQYIEDYFNKIISSAEEKNILFEWESNDEVSNRNYHSAFIPNRRFFGDYLVKLNNLYYMLCVDDAEYYMTLIHNRMVEEKLNVEKSDKFKFYAIRSVCNVLKQDNNGAMLMCEKLLPLFEEKKDLWECYIYNFICGMSQMGQIQSELTYKYAAKCMDIARQMNDDKLLFCAEVLEQGAQFSGWRDVFAVDFDKVIVSEDMVFKLKKYNYMNILCYYTIFGYDNDRESIRMFANGVESETYKKAISIGKKLGNTNFLLSAYTKYIVMFSEQGYNKYCDKFYGEKLKIINSENNNCRKAHLYLGMGYNSIVAEQFIKANEYFNKGIELLYEAKNAENIMEALYNMAINCICAQDFLSACDYLTTIFKMLDNLEMKTIQICNASKLYGLLALSYYMIENEYRCYKCISDMETQISHLIYPEAGEEPDYHHWHEDLFLYNFMNGILTKNNGEFSQAENYFRKAEEHFDNYSTTMFYCIVNFTVEYYDLYMKCNKQEKAMEILEKGLEYCKDNGYLLKSQNIMLMIEGKSINARPLTADFSTISLRQLIELSYNVGKEKQLSERKKDIKFLSSLQELLSSDDIDYKVLINNTMTTLQNNFNLDGMMLLEKNKNNFIELYKDTDKDISYGYKDIFDFFRLMKREFLVNRTDKSFQGFNKIVSLFGRNKIVTVVGVPIINEQEIESVFLATINMHRNFRRNRILLTEDDLVIIKTAIVQLSSGIERIKNRENIVEINEKLNALAVTDMLTGLYNRQGFAKKVEEQINCNNSVSILYADLDNFKYYNDTFGHDVGDVVLVEFAKVFKKVSEGLGYAVRYGGDEFLVVLNNVSKDEVRRVANAIYDAISDGFIDVVSKYINRDVDIPHNKLVSCSIGIDISDNSNSENIKETLQNADKALYYMKKRQKGNYILWEDVDEEESN